jgi:hypothetical protein
MYSSSRCMFRPQLQGSMVQPHSIMAAGLASIDLMQRPQSGSKTVCCIAESIL